MHIFGILILTVSPCPTRLMTLAYHLTHTTRALCINDFTPTGLSRFFARLVRVGDNSSLNALSVTDAVVDNVRKELKSEPE